MGSHHDSQYSIFRPEGYIDRMSFEIKIGRRLTAVRSSRITARLYRFRPSQGGDALSTIKSLESVGDQEFRKTKMIQAGVAYISPDPKIGSKPSPTDVPVLTPKQGRILRCLGRGLTIRTIVLDLGLSIRTIESHKSTIMQELSVHGTRDLVVRAKHLGLLS